MDLTMRQQATLTKCADGRVRRTDPNGYDYINGSRDERRVVRGLERLGLVAPHERTAWPRLVLPTEEGQRAMAEMDGGA